MITQLFSSSSSKTLRAELAALKAEMDAERSRVAQSWLDVQQEWLSVARQQQETLQEMRASHEPLQRMKARIDVLEHDNAEAKNALAKLEQGSIETAKHSRASEQQREQLETSLTKLGRRFERHTQEADRVMLALAERITTMAP